MTDTKQDKAAKLTLAMSYIEHIQELIARKFEADGIKIRFEDGDFDCIRDTFAKILVDIVPEDVLDSALEFYTSPNGLVFGKYLITASELLELRGKPQMMTLLKNLKKRIEEDEKSEEELDTPS